MTNDGADYDARSATTEDLRRRFADYLPRKRNLRRRDLRWSIVLFSAAAAALIEGSIMREWLTDEEAFWFQSIAVFSGVVGVGFLLAFLLVRDDGEE